MTIAVGEDGATIFIWIDRRVAQPPYDFDAQHLLVSTRLTKRYRKPALVLATPCGGQ
ncbi:MAG: hypothetical protein OXN95_04790 [bacterium]|nr:hypothetical protein [bacterium]